MLFIRRPIQGRLPLHIATILILILMSGSYHSGATNETKIAKVAKANPDTVIKAESPSQGPPEKTIVQDLTVLDDVSKDKNAQETKYRSAKDSKVFGDEILPEDVFIFSTFDGALTGVNARTGSILWKLTSERPIVANESPSFEQSVVLDEEDSQDNKDTQDWTSASETIPQDLMHLLPQPYIDGHILAFQNNQVQVMIHFKKSSN